MKNLSRLLPALLLGPVFSQDFDLTVDPSSSTSDVLANFAAELPGTVIGDYDAVNNPGGTLTLPGLSGGSGNQPVPMDITLSGVNDSLTSAGGVLSLGVDLVGSTLSVSGLDLDLLNGASSSADIVATLLFGNFRTFQPDSVFFGGVPIDLPLGAQSVTDLVLVQIGPSVGGVLNSTADPDRYDFSVQVPSELSFIVDFEGTPTPVGPLAVLAPVAGDLTVDSGGITWNAAIDLVYSETIIDPVPGFMIVDQPFDVPTVLPPGYVAHLLFSSPIDSIQYDLDLDIQLVATGDPACGFELYCDTNANSTGLPAEIQISGSTDVADQSLTLDVTSLPAGEFGYFLMSESRTSVPGFGGSQGILCVGSPQYRFSKDVLTTGTGALSFSPDFNSLPQDVVFTAGSTWNFQLWYRDGLTSNTSGGATVVFCP